MKVSLISYTQDALDLLIFTKSTRLKQCNDTFNKIREMSDEEKMKEIKYIFGTIASSWEFIDYIFLIEGVTRAFTHQLVRHRVGVAFAQQAQRVVNMSDFECLETGKAKNNPIYKEAVNSIREAYQKLINQGVNPQDARGILPTNILTNIIMKINLRALAEMMGKRLCVKSQGEFQDVVREIRRTAIAVHPWTEPIMQVYCVQHDGSCLFKNYDDCFIKKAGFIAKNADTEAIKNLWENYRAECQPKGA